MLIAKQKANDISKHFQEVFFLMFKHEKQFLQPVAVGGAESSSTPFCWEQLGGGNGG